MLRELPVGLSEWDIRQSDFYVLMSKEAQDIIRQQGIILLDYCPLQQVWKAM